jgi:membrane protease YdiL (CAAX protease family)
VTLSSLPSSIREQVATVMNRLRRLVARFPVVCFVALAIAAQVGLVWGEVKGTNLPILTRVRIYLPAFIALALTALLDGREGLKKTLRTLMKVNLNWRWFLVAALFAPVAGIVPLVVFRAIGVVDRVNIETEVLSHSGILFFKLILTIAIVEEISWVSFVIARLQNSFTPFIAALLGGAYWGIWYVPLNVAGIQVAGSFPNVPMVMNFMAIGACCSWVYLKTGSAVLVALMQVGTNYVSLVFPVVPTPGKVAAYYAFIATKFLLAVVAFYFWGPRPMIRGTRVST